MPTVALNDRRVAGLKPIEKPIEYFDRGFPGFALRVWPSGVKSFVLFYRQNRRLRRYTIGQYPAVKLATARSKARAALMAVSEGRDPAAEHQAARVRTWGALADRYLEKYAKKRKRSWRDDQSRLKTQVNPAWAHRPIAEIRRADVRELVEGIADRPAPVLANRVLMLIRTVFNFAIDQEWLEHNPAQRLRSPAEETARDRVLSDAEIRALWTFLHADSTASTDVRPQRARWVRLTRAMLALRLITAQRGAEIAAMRDVDLDGDWWTIPAEVAKNGLTHRVFLTDLAKAVIARAKTEATRRSPYVFCGVRSAMQRQGALTGLPIENFQPRDLRRTAASNMTKAGVSRLVVSKVLNHVERGITAVYDRHSYDAEKRSAMLTWESVLRRILDSSSPDS